MKRYLVSIDYAGELGAYYEWYVDDVLYAKNLTFNEIKGFMYNALLEYVELEILTYEQAYKMVGDFLMFNMFMEEYFLENEE